MQSKITRAILALMVIALLLPAGSWAADPETSPEEAPAFGISEDMGEAMVRQAAGGSR